MVKNIFLILLAFFFVVSCNTDDDICSGGEGTPRMKIKFKTLATGKPRTLDTIFVNVNYGNGEIAVVKRMTKTDSILIPLRVDDVAFTEMAVSISQKGPQAKIKVNHTTRTEYVSPACGIRKLYENVNSTLIIPNPVIGIENAQTEIVNENKTHLFLLF